MNESKAETKLVKIIKANGGLALKLRHRFMAGLPDLYLKMPLHEGVFVECKYQPWPKRKHRLDLNLSALQRDFIKKCHQTGQPAVWALFSDVPYTAKKSRLVMVIGANPSLLEVDAEDFSDVMKSFVVSSDDFFGSNANAVLHRMIKIAREY